MALWTGGNETDEASFWSGFDVDPNTDVITRQVFPQVVEQYDPMRSYLPSSPYYGPELVRLGSRMDMMPEVHLWGPRGYYKGPYYTEVNAHFASEIGYHGCPSRRSLEQMLDPEYVYPWVKDWQWNDEWLTKSVRWHPKSKETEGRNDLMVKQLRYLFGTVPRDLNDFIAASQITQAEGLKFFIEFWRHDKWQRSGIIWWNLRDGWPIISDAVVDYYNRKKLAYAYIKRVQVNVVALCAEPVDGKHSVYVVNDTLQPATGHLRIHDADTDRQLLETDFKVDSKYKVIVGQISAADKPEMWLIEWQLSDGSKFRNHYLAGKPPVRLEDYRRWLPKLGLPPEEQWVKFGVDGVQ
jgi:beta-mannosidase